MSWIRKGPTPAVATAGCQTRLRMFSMRRKPPLGRREDQPVGARLGIGGQVLPIVALSTTLGGPATDLTVADRSVTDILAVVALFNDMNTTGWQAPASDLVGGWPSTSVTGWRRVLPLLALLVVLAGVILLLALVVAPSAGAAGGCGGG